jgi:hypothetical protein
MTIGCLSCEWASNAQGRARKDKLDLTYSRETQRKGAEKRAGRSPKYFEMRLNTNPKNPKYDPR